MSLPNGVQYSNKRLYVLTWQDEDGAAVNLTGASLYGIIERGGTQSLITGTLALVTAASGIFSWDRSEADVATAGTHFVQFYAKYASDSGKPEISFRHKWFVAEAFNFPFVSPSLSPSASVSPSASASDSA